ncbi:hypothetical protein [Clostridium kluyveri]|uniref:Uncharacterized protein n=1 Tax=Clostridium kluyveri TaxID=1534 RepID=A0A1L5F2Z3_CLOKL|nr:hypothetical protein [Clostridium kluyveri]APM37375.1 hypothetical protein BS101_00630 [Clostridium kluyveri]
MNFYKILSEKPRIKLEDYSLYLNGFFNNNKESFKCHKILIINLRISNISLVPASLKNAIIKYNTIILRPNPRYKINEISIKHSESSGTSYLIDKQLDFPVIIEPMQIINCSLIFPFADELFKVYVDNNCKPIEIVLTLFTPDKNLKFKTKIFELNKENITNCQHENKEKLYRM